MSTRTSLHKSIHTPIPHVHMLAYTLHTCLSARCLGMNFHMPVCISTPMSIMHVRMSTHLSVHMSVHMSAHASKRMSTRRRCTSWLRSRFVPTRMARPWHRFRFRQSLGSMPTAIADGLQGILERGTLQQGTLQGAPHHHHLVLHLVLVLFLLLVLLLVLLLLLLLLLLPWRPPTEAYSKAPYSNAHRCTVSPVGLPPWSVVVQ